MFVNMDVDNHCNIRIYENMEEYAFYLQGIIGFAIIGLLLFTGSRRVRNRSETRQSDESGNYESLVAYIMLVGALFCFAFICFLFVGWLV